MGVARGRCWAAGVVAGVLACVLAVAPSASADVPDAPVLSGGASQCVPDKSTIAQCFPDKALAQAIANRLKYNDNAGNTGEVLTSQNVNNTTTLMLNVDKYSSIASVQGLQVFTNLQYLTLSGTQVSDVSPLAGLTKLLDLDLSGSRVSDVSSLAKLTNLVWLNLSDTPVSDVSPLAKLTNLGTLFLRDTQVSNVSPLANLLNLEWLVLDGTPVSDVSPLAKLTNLSYLWLSGTGVLDLSVLQGLPLRSGFAPSSGWSPSFAGVRPCAKLTVGGDGSVSMPAPRWLDGTLVAPSSTSPAGGTLDAKRGVVVWKTYDPKASYSYDFKQSFTLKTDHTAVEFSGHVSGVKPVAKTFAVSFDSAGGSSVASQTVEYGAKVSVPKDPVRAGYTFQGWYTARTGGSRYDFGKPVTGGLTLYARWKAVPTTPVKPTTPSKPAVSMVVMFRLYNRFTGEHFYTSSSVERDSLVKVGWRSEGTGWVAPVSGAPVYRLYNPYAPGGDHHYTMSTKERDALVKAGWRAEGIGWYSGGTVKVLREYNPYARTGTHNYTTDPKEDTALVKAGWRAEGTGWYAVKAK